MRRSVAWFLVCVVVTAALAVVSALADIPDLNRYEGLLNTSVGFGLLVGIEAIIVAVISTAGRTLARPVAAGAGVVVGSALFLPLAHALAPMVCAQYPNPDWRGTPYVAPTPLCIDAPTPADLIADAVQGLVSFTIWVAVIFLVVGGVIYVIRQGRARGDPTAPLPRAGSGDDVPA
jgi:hypothetical protein